MPIGSPLIIGPVTPCSDQVRVTNQFSGARVRLFVAGDPTPVGDAVVPWSDFLVNVDRTRLVPGKKLVATQEFGAEVSKPSPKGVSIEVAAFGSVTFEALPYVCGRSVLLRVKADPKAGAAAGSRIEVWQGSTKLGTGVTIGTLCRVDLDPGRSITGGAALGIHQFICTGGTTQTNSGSVQIMPPLVLYH